MRPDRRRGGSHAEKRCRAKRNVSVEEGADITFNLGNISSEDEAPDYAATVSD